MRWLMTVVLVCACMAGCGSDKDREQPDLLVSTPLEFDPTEEHELSRWWSNGTQLLRLDEDGGYELFASTNRFAKPVERGRWSRQSYAVLWLEPYRTRTPQRHRIQISKIDGRLALELPKLKPPHMLAIDHPPEVIEDRMLGVWSGPLGELTLRSDMRYSLRLDGQDDGGRPAFRGSENGRWRIADNHLVLQPDAPGLEPSRMPLAIDEKRVTINAPGGALTRAEPGAM